MWQYAIATAILVASGCGGFRVVPLVGDAGVADAATNDPRDGSTHDGAVDLSAGVPGGDGSVATPADFAGLDLAGAAWTVFPATVSFGEVYCIWERAAGEIYMVVSNGGVVRSQDDGLSFSIVDTGSSSLLYAIWADDTNVYAVGERNTILHAPESNLAVWTNVGANATADMGPAPQWNAVMGDASGVYITGEPGYVLQTTDNGATFTSTLLNRTAEFHGIWTNGTDRYIVGFDDGTSFPSPLVFHSSSAGWAAQTVPNLIGSNGLYAVWGSGSDVFAVGGWASQTYILHTSNQGQTWAVPSTTLPITDERMSGVWGSSATDVYLVGNEGDILHTSDATSYTQDSFVAAGKLEAIGGSGPADIFIGGYTTGPNAGTYLAHYH